MYLKDAKLVKIDDSEAAFDKNLIFDSEQILHLP